MRRLTSSLLNKLKQKRKTNNLGKKKGKAFRVFPNLQMLKLSLLYECTLQDGTMKKIYYNFKLETTNYKVLNKS